MFRCELKKVYYLLVEFIIIITKKSLKNELLGGNCDPGLVENSYGSYDMESCYMECRDK